MAPLPAELRRAYLARLGLEPEPPSAEALRRLHRAHVERVAYETLWIQTGEARGIEPAASVAAIGRGRGGYCFQLNGALALLLEALGYRVTRHVGGVHGPDGPSEDEMGNHLVLLVHELDESPDGTWYVDVGLGDALHDPLPLRPQHVQQGPFALGLEATTDGPGEWHLTHDDAGAFRGMSWRAEPTGMDAFAARHVELSTSPDSGFVRFLTAQRRDAMGVDSLKGLVLRRIGAGASERDLTSRAELEEALVEVFSLDLTDLSADALDHLWARLSVAHDEWDAAGRP